ncbi:IS3 family transposase [Leisingera aquaemixtae]|nr:IS3 family transposase [Leisingera aquaemixtae]
MEPMGRDNRSNRYSPETRERAVRMVLDNEGQYQDRSAAIRGIAPKIGCSRESLRRWVAQSEVDRGHRGGETSEERARIRELEREVRELRQANEILRKASAYFGPGGARPPTEAMISFIDEHRMEYGVEPICKVLPIAPSTYYSWLSVARDPSRASDCARRDAELLPQIQRVWEENFEVYGVRKVWHQLRREGFSVARCTVERLMRQLGIQGVIRGKPRKTTLPDPALPCPLDRVNRRFRAAAPNTLWVSDFTYVSTWQGFVYVAFVTDTFANRIVGWRASRSQQTQFVLDALEQALCERRPAGGLTHHSDRGGQYLSIRYTERLAEAGIEPSVGSVGDSYDNALAETIIGLFKAEVIHRLGPWKSADAVEWETLKWVDWFNNRRLLGPVGNIPPAEAERNFYVNAESLNMVA